MLKELVIGMKKQLLIHSFWSKNCDSCSFFVNIATYILSCIYAKRCGYDLHLFTDKTAEEYLKIAPYDSINTCLDELDSPAKEIYAWPKFIALQQCPLDAVHIDGDVFIKKYIDFEINKYDVLVQDCEYNDHIWPGAEANLKSVQHILPNWANKNSTTMYNCGVLGVFNQKIKDIFCSNYWNMVQQYKLHAKHIKGDIPDVIFEQKMLYDLSMHNNLRVKELLRFDYRNQDATSISYQHLIGYSKYKCISHTLKVLKNLDTVVYLKLKNMFYGIFKSQWA